MLVSVYTGCINRPTARLTGYGGRPLPCSIHMRVNHGRADLFVLKKLMDSAVSGTYLKESSLPKT